MTITEPLNIRGLDYVNSYSEAKKALMDAIAVVAAGGQGLVKQYIGCKRYEGWFQRCDCDYGYGPTHGGIVMRIELNNDLRKRLRDGGEMTPEEIKLGLAQLGIGEDMKTLQDLIDDLESQLEATRVAAQNNFDSFFRSVAAGNAVRASDAKSYLTKNISYAESLATRINSLKSSRALNI